jgi:hypothetical protein
MQANEREHETLDVLDEVVEAAESLGVLAVVDVDKRADLARCEGDVLVAEHNLELLAADTIGRWPHLVVLLHDLRVLDDALELVHDGLVGEALLANQRVVLVVGVVGVAELAIRPELELEELVAEFAAVTHVVAQIELVRCCRGHFFFLLCFFSLFFRI